MKTKLLLLILLSPILLLTGCITALQSDKIVSIKQRVFGVVVETANSANGTPSVKLGFSSTVWQMIPTSTNGPVYAPKYMDVFDLKQGINPFATGIKEDTGTGDVLVGSGTNDSSKAIIPSAYVK